MSYDEWDTHEAFSMLQNAPQPMAEGIYTASLECDTPEELRELWEQSGIDADIPQSKRVDPDLVDWAEVLSDIKGE